MAVRYVDLNEDQSLCRDHDAAGLLDHGDPEDRPLGHEGHDEVVGLLLREDRGGQLGHHTFV